MKELLQAGVHVPIAMKASKQVGNYSDDAQHIIDRQHSALILMSMILDDVRRGYPKLSAELDRIIQEAIDNAGTGPELAERLEQETWIGVDWSQSFILRKQAEAVEAMAKRLQEAADKADEGPDESDTACTLIIAKSMALKEAYRLRQQADEMDGKQQ